LRVKAEKAVNLDALLKRDDFFAETEQESDTNELRITDLEPGITFNRLRKPDFQRETANWTPQQIVDLIQTWCSGDIIPAIILWESGHRIFVIDGAHRLSALIGWINDDFGGGKISASTYGVAIPAHQIRLHKQTQELIMKSIGSWEDFKNNHPSWSMKTLQVQWIKGRTAKQAAKAFVRINQGGTEIDNLEARILFAARSSLSVATRSIVRSGTGHPYWKHFSNEDAKANVAKLGEQINNLLYNPEIKSPISDINVPLAGAIHGTQALRLAFDLVATANKLSIPDSTRSSIDKEPLPDDEDGMETLNLLRRTRKVIQMILSNEPNSFGLHPGLWFYNENGSFVPAALLNVMSWMLELESLGKLDLFRKNRGRLEELILDHPSLVRPATNTLGSGTRTRKRMVSILNTSLNLLTKYENAQEVWEVLIKEQPDLRRDEEKKRESSKRGAIGASFPLAVKNAATLADLRFAPKCSLCKGLLHANGRTLDHVEERKNGGRASVDNSRWVHPVCNSNRAKDEAAAAL
jgi:Protein of unknown function DUF262